MRLASRLASRRASRRCCHAKCVPNGSKRSSQSQSKDLAGHAATAGTLSVAIIGVLQNSSLNKFFK
jgi:hypothetical protein